MYRGDDVIHRNDGGNVFTPVTIAAFSVMSQAIATNGIAWCDYDNDGDMDVYVCKNNGGNFLFRSNGAGGFFNVTFNPEMTANISGYGCAWGDVNNDGLQDLWINGTFSGGDRLFINNGGGTFTRNTTSPVVTLTNVSQAGASFADYDNDGDLDLMVPTFNQNLLFTNGGTGNFTQNTTEVVATDGPVESYAAAWADYDNDGDLDLFVPTAFGDPNDELYRNNVFQNNTTNSSWIKFKMNGNINNRNGVGARIRVRAVINGVNVFQTKQVNINPATNVLLRDVLDDDLDISTLQILGSSHSISRYQIIPNNALIIEFDSIMLPSNLVDELGSNGYVIISILPKANLVDGTQIQNQVGIYFDGNEVVLTNSVLNTLYDNPFTDASFTYKNSCATPGLAYDFTYTGNTANDATFSWSFEDGVTPTSNLQSPSNIVFNTGGAKQVSLTVNRNGCIATYSDSINVSSYANITNAKIEVCHNGNTLLINQNAIASHIAHGDCIGACASADSTMNKSAKKQLISESKIDFEFYPNPANTQINVKINPLSQKNNVFLIELYNFSGTKVLDKITASNNFEEIINTTDLPTGIYLMKVSNNNESCVKKVFIQH